MQNLKVSTKKSCLIRKENNIKTMNGRKVKLRIIFVLLFIITLALTVFLVLKSLEENVVYFQSPTELKVLPELQKKKDKSGWNGKK